ncbi:MAG: SGNH/GDSL hydrolase family protein [Clostridia bacterium]|nr:SGNH/GDSL hydrolase family protein [Clostridia bacterium]
MSRFDRIMVWGDSLLQGVALDADTKRYIRLDSAGCVGLVSEKLNLPVENFAHFGYVTEKGRRLLRRRLILDEKAGVDLSRTLNLICFGGNDTDHYWEEIAKVPDMEHVSHVSVEDYTRNLTEMIEMIREAGSTAVFMNLPIIDAERYFNWFTREFSDEGRNNVLKWLEYDLYQIYRSHEHYNNILMQTARRHGCEVIDVRTSFLKERHYRDYICIDGIHPNAEGHKKIAGEVIAFIKERLPEILSE